MMTLRNTIPLLFISRKAWPDMLYTTAILLCISFAALKFETLLPRMSIAVPLFSGIAILIMLSVKFIRAYDRWWETRKTWETIVNDSRSFVRYLQYHIGKEERPTIKKIAFRHIAWCYSFNQFIRGETSGQNPENFLSEEDMAFIGKSNYAYQAIQQLNTSHISNLVTQGKLTVSGQIQLNNIIVNFSRIVSTAEPIKSPIFPAAFDYFLYAGSFLFITSFFCSFFFIGGVFKISALFILSLIFLLMEKTVQYLRDPFGHLKTDPVMATVSGVIEKDIKKMLDQAEIAEQKLPKLLYIL